MRLRNLNINSSDVKLVSIDRRAEAPLAPIKPRRGLIIVLSLIIGLTVGLLFALAANLASNRRHQ
ncbi:GNVR domain-containing protein [Pseudomonas sp. Q1]|uniref:GNVR domain-containing protein n=1 Tax=Pseudomonas sp. Q1 TaxID=2202823 RepID=UPI00211596D2|nr:GNVR domain-containing protein [Pseudomonas sp. Q1]